MSQTFISIDKTNNIKGLAILAVVLVHVLAYFPGIYNSDQQLLYVSLDQLARFCIPGFIILSGYGLSEKYKNKQINYYQFLKKRIIKLLPLYLIWSIFSILIINSIPAWSFGNQPKSIFIQLLTGQADYQLYFLPVIFQLYIIFPLIIKFKKKIKTIFFIALFLQSILYIYFYLKSSNSDRLEYTLFLSWISYFVFGIYLNLKKIPNILIKLASLSSVIFSTLLIFSSIRQINSGVDPLPALKFTRLLIIPFGFFTNLKLITTKFSYRFLNWLGKNSYIIYLSHTVGLRIIYAISKNQLEPKIILEIIMLWATTIYLSNNLSKKIIYSGKQS